jgi:imidazolonepropionase-like amidohydrolase
VVKPQLVKNVMIFDGTGSDCFAGEVLVEGNRIKTVARAGNITCEGVEVVDGGGHTLMPGLCEAHAHVTYSNMTYLKELGQIPPEEHLLLAIGNAKLMLDSGFTSLYSAASTKIRTEVVLRNAINAGKFPGPRIRAASPEIVATGGLGDERQMHMHHQGVEVIADGADEVRRVVRTMIREGVDTVKINISGDNFVRQNFGQKLSYTDDEVAAAAEVAHERGAWLSCHARADAAVRMALRHGFRCIYHCDFIQGETFDLLEAQRDRVFLAPAIGIIYATAYEAHGFGVSEEVARHMGMMDMIDGFPRVYGELWRRGMRILPGGDYGFAWNPIGNNARDLEHFVRLLGLTPAQALMSATKWGGEIMGIADLGLVKEGYLADLILVKGDPTRDVKLLQDRNNLLLIMKDGAYHKHPNSSDHLKTSAKAVPHAVWETA